MHKYKEVEKRILAIILMICMVVSLLPDMPVSAATDIDIKNATITLYTDAAYTSQVSDSSYTYTGSAYTPYAKVTYNGTTLTTADYELSYTNNINAGTATVTAQGLGSYTGTLSKEFKINPITLNSVDVACAMSESGVPYAYYDTSTGKSYPEIKTVTGYIQGGGGTVLLKSTDYSVSYTNNSGVYSGSVTSGSGPYMTIKLNSSSNYALAGLGEQNIYYRIYYDISSIVSVAGISSLTYTGLEQTPAPTVTNNNKGTTLSVGSDYSYAWTNNTAAGTAKLTLTGIGDYKGTKSVDYTIAAADVSSASVSVALTQTEFDYTGSKIALDSYITIKIGSYTVPSANYKLTYNSNYSGALGNNTVKVTGTGNLTGEKTLTFKIVNAIVSATLSSSSLTYTGSKNVPTVTVKDRTGAVIDSSKYTLTYYTSNGSTYYANLVDSPTAVGTYYIRIEATGDNLKGTLGTEAAPISFAIAPKAISGCTFDLGSWTNVTASDDYGYYYDGTSHKPTLTVKNGSVTLTKDTDYSYDIFTDSACTALAPSSIKDAGTYYIKITGLNSYAGSTHILHYKINPKILTDVTVTIPDQTYTGSAVIPDASVITVTSASLVSGDTLAFNVVPGSYANNVNIGTNTASLVIQLTGNYTTNTTTSVNGTAYTGTKTGTFTIRPKMISECITNVKEGSSIYDSSQVKFTYNGSIQSPKVVVKDGTKTLTAGTDYEVGYYTDASATAVYKTTGQKNAGTYYVKISGLGSYASANTGADIIAPYTISAKSMTVSDVTVTTSNQAYTGAMVTAVLTVMDGTTLLTSGTDYKILGYFNDEACTIASNHTDAGLVYVKLQGLGNYGDTRVASFYIGTDLSKQTASVKVSGAPFTYDTTSHYTDINSGITVYDTSGAIVDSSNYTVIYYSDSAHTKVVPSTDDVFKNAGTVYIGITGKTGYYGTYYSSCTIDKRSIEGMDATVLGTYTYSGSGITLSINDGTIPTKLDGVKLTYPATAVVTGTLSANDYTITSYSNNINAGTTAAVTLTGKGNYSGTKIVNFTITPKTLDSLSSLNVSIPTATYTSQKQEPAVKLTYGASSTALTLGTDYTTAYYRDAAYSTAATDTNLTNAGTVYVKITGKGNYTGTLTGPYTYTIDPRNLSETTVDISGNSYVYSAITNASKIPTFKVRYKYATDSYYELSSGTDFAYDSTTVAYKVGEHQLDLSAGTNGNFTGNKKISYYYMGNMDNSAGEITVSGLTSSVAYTSSTATSGATFGGLSISYTQGGSAQVLPSSYYTVTYTNNKTAGVATLTITGNPNYYWSGTYTYNFKITGSVADAVITIPDQTYTGAAYTGDTLKNVRVVADGYELVYGKDYEVVSDGMKNATEAALSTSSNAPSVTIKGIGDYFDGTPTKTQTFSIKYDISGSGMTVSDIADQTYTGSAVTPAVTVKYRNANDTYTDLTQGKDYTVAYYNNINVAAANGTTGPYMVITSTGTGLLAAGSKTIPFTIGKVDLTDGYSIQGVTEGADYSYTGAIIKPTLTVVKNGVALDASNYTIGYVWSPTSSVPQAGSVETITITGKGNYYGSLTVKINVVKRDLSDETEAAAVIADQTYTGTALEPTFDVTFTDYAGVNQKLKLGTDYRIVGYYYNTDALTADTDYPYTGGPYVTIEAISGSSCEGTRNIPFTILPKSMDKLTYSAVSDMTYEAGVEKYDPAVTVKMSATSTTPLVKNEAYYLEYVNDTKVGTANNTNGPYIRVTPANSNFTGEKIIPYTISPKSIKATDVNLALQDTTNTTFDSVNLNYPYVAGTIYTPTVVMTDKYGTEDALALTKDTDYKVTYTNNTYTGTATVTITGAGNYTGTRTIKFTIGTLFTSAKIAVYKDNVQVTALPSVIYDGTDKTPSGITVKLISTAALLVQGTDYEVRYYKDSDCTVELASGSLINAGTYYVAVTGLAAAGYVGSIVLPYTIKQKSINSSDITAKDITDQIYSAGNIQPSVELTDTSVDQVVPSSAYDVTYQGTETYGTARAIVTANESGNYTGSRTVYFEIVRADIGTATVNTIPTYIYTGLEITPDPEVYMEGNRLVKGIDYTVTYYNNTQAGTGKVYPYIVILGKGNYTGKKDVSFSIKADISTATVSSVSTQLYTGKAITPAITVNCGGNTLTLGSDYTVTYLHNTEIGEAAIVIEAKEGSYYTGSRTIKFTIGNNISMATVAGMPSSQTYNKQAITPEPVLYVGSQKLAKGTDYTLKWVNDVNAGTASVVISGTGAYAGTKTVNYSIIAKGIARCKIDAVSNLSYTGKAQTPQIVVRDENKILAKGTDYTVTYSNNKTIGTATATITGKGNYSGSAVVKFNIVSAPISGLKASGQTTTAAKLSWSKLSNITGYQVYTNDSRTKVYQGTATSVTISKLKAGTTYKYKVRTYTKIGSKTYYGDFKTITFSTQPATPTIKVTSTSAKKAQVSWGKVSGASGYVIYRATSQKGSYQKVATVTKGSTTSYTNTGLTSQRTYYYKVRAYSTVDGKNVYSSYSGIVSVQVR